MIDPELRSLKIVKSSGMPSDLRLALGSNSLQVVRVADAGRSWDCAWYNEGALYRGNPVHAFKFHGHRNPFAGKCILVGIDKTTGAVVDAGLDYIELRGYVHWLGLILPEVTLGTTKEGVTITIVTYSRVKVPA